MIEQAKAFAEENNLGFLETSALQATNVEEAFTLVITGLFGLFVCFCFFSDHFFKGIYEELGRRSLNRTCESAHHVTTGQAIQLETKKKASPKSRGGCC